MQLIVEKLVDAIEGIFSREISDALNKAQRSLSTQDIVLYDETLIKKLVRQLLEYHVERLCKKTFIYEFHKYRKSLSLPADSSSSKAFSLYVSQIDGRLIRGWFSKYDSLRKMVTKAVKNSCNYVEEVCADFNEDIELLCERHMVERGDRLQTIVPLDSDPHNGSKVALCFEFESVRKVIYKYRSMEVDYVIDGIFKNILKFDALPVKSPIASTINKENYGWQSYIKGLPMEPKEVPKAYYNLGLCAAVFSSLGVTDLHDENIIFRGTSPYFIDLETGLRPSFHQTCNSLNEVMEDVLFRSVVATSILPAKLPTIPHQILIGAINTPYPQKTSEKIFTIRNFGTDAIDIAKENIEVTRPSLPVRVVGNKLLDPLQFQTDFLKGYEDGYKRMISKRDQIYNELLNIKCLVRVIVRPTVQYALMLDACLYPENLVNENSIDKILHYLKPTRLVQDPEIAQAILFEEWKALRDGDIPYFCMEANDTHMRSGAFISESAFSVSPVKNAIQSLERLSEKRLLQDKRLIAESYAEIRVQEAQYTKKVDMGYESPFFAQMLKKVTKDNPYPIINLIQDLRITSKNDKTGEVEIGWLGGVYGDCAISYDSTNLISFHDTGGIILLFEHLSEYGKSQSRDDYSKLYEQSKSGVSSLYSNLSARLDSDLISIISGSSSFDYIFHHKERRLEKTEKIVMNMDPESIQLGDVYQGVTGIGLLLATFPDTNSSILQTMNHLILNDTRKKFSKEGIAHGELGVIWAQFRLSFVKDDLKKCRELYQYTKQLSFNLVGWCNGNAGLLMVLAEMSGALKIESNFHQIATKATELSLTEAIDLSICHGAAGVLQSLLFSYVTLGKPWYLSLANNYWNKVLKLADRNGFCTGERNRDYLLGYFLGWSGVADSALLLHRCNSGKSVWFPLNLSSNEYQKKLVKEDEL